LVLPYFLVSLLFVQASPSASTGSVAGQVLTRDGVAASAVRVSAVLAPPPGARPEDGVQSLAPPAPVASALTNAEGRYRLGNLPPGRYHIVAGMLGQGTYHPATTDRWQADVVSVTAGTTVENRDIRIVIPFGGRVRGRVTPAPPAGQREIAVLSGLKLDEIYEVPVAADGSFEFGHVPRGVFMVNVFPTPPGVPSLTFEVGDADVTNVEFKRAPLRTVSGRIIAQRGPVPNGVLAFSTSRDVVTAAVADDGTFTARVSAGRHLIDLGGMPVGYSLGSARIGAADVTTGLTVGDADVAGVVITVAAPGSLPRLRGTTAAALVSRVAGTTVLLTGPIVGSMSTAVKADGTFEFAALPPARYRLGFPQLPDISPIDVVVTRTGGEVEVSGPPR
jgi:hypothetical protein